MTDIAFEGSGLWARTLAPQTGDLYEQHRDRLRVALLQMRQNVIPFVRSIHTDVTGLTVHDESHLDALWEMANLIIPEDFELNPLEAFVFGCSILLHDTAMSVATYTGGLKELKELGMPCAVTSPRRA